MNNLDWLLDSDPAIRWQALHDLTDSSPADLAAERSRIPHEGLGAQILSTQQPDGSWRKPDTPVWLPTLFTLILLRTTGIDPNDPAVRSAIARAKANLRWNDSPGCWDLRPPDFVFPNEKPHGCKEGGNPFFEGEEEPCINGGVLAFGAYFRHPNETLARRLLGEQLEDGGWNCEAPKSTRSSFHTTICVLEGIIEFERAIGPAHPLAGRVAASRRRAEEYLLERVLFRRLSTGEIVSPEFIQLAFPPRYHYDVLRALDYFRASGAAPDPRIGEAVALIRNRQLSDGRWSLDHCYDEGLPFPFPESAGHPSRWNTLRSLRVLRWYEQAQT